jgi:hypothetical protein
MRLLWLAVIALGLILTVGIVNIWPNSLTDNELGVVIALVGIYGYGKGGKKR